LYSLAAAGVSLLALGQPAESEVVFTKKTIPIPITQGCCQGVEISFANNGQNNLGFFLYSFGSSRVLNVHPLSSKESGVIAQSYVLALTRGAKIGPSDTFSNGYGRTIESTSRSTRGDKLYRGYWAGNPTNRYVGVRFFISGQMHYGWVRLTVNTSKQHVMSATITGYAYETVPNKAILAGTAAKTTAGAKVPGKIQNQDGASLGMLALGAESLPLWRREETLSSR
jgi:hypothetical protein